MKHLHLIVLICLSLSIITLFTFWQIQDHDFIYLDDNIYLIENPHIQTGATLQNIKWAFTTNYPDYWHPLPWLTHMIDISLYGLNPKGHHFNNLLFHIANTLLLFLFLYRSTNSTWKSAFVAALFALHPLHVESVAWATERKDVLSTFFLFITLLTYTYYTEKPGFMRYLFILVSFALGLMSKPMLVTLPFLLILLDYWPLRRLNFGQSNYSNKPNAKKTSIFGLLLEKVPLLILSAILIVIIFSQKHGAEAFIPPDYVPITLRVSNAIVSYTVYLLKMVWPAGLAIFYPYPDFLSLWHVAGSVILLLTISCLVFRWRLPHPYLITGWLWYLGTLVPVIGLVQWGAWPAMADRFTYVPLTGVFIISAWGIPEILGRHRHKKTILITSASIVLLLLVICTWLQVRHWQNSKSILEHTLNVTSNNYLMHNNYGRQILIQNGKIDEAMSHFNKALNINPRSGQAHNNIGVILARRGELEEAASRFSKALKIQPYNEQAHYNFGLALAQQGKQNEAIMHFQKALWVNPDYVDARFNLGMLLAGKGEFDKAVDQYQRLLVLKPDHLYTQNNLGVLFFKKGNIEKAIFHF